MALVACTQLKELDLRYTELTGEWLVGIDRGPVPSEQRMERASWNTPELLIFDTNFVFWVCATRKYLSWVLKIFLSDFCSHTFHIYSAPFACQIKRSSAQSSDHSAI